MVHPDSGRAPSTTDADIEVLIQLLSPRERIVAFTGAGISTESGIPDYRGPNGVWTTGKLPTISDFATNPETRRQYWENRRGRYEEMLALQPNAGHRALVELERAGRLTGIITQNIDGLHQRAGSSPDRVWELHGTTHRIRCMDCGRTWDAEEIHARLANGESVPACEVCGGPLRTATVLFGESIPQDALQGATDAALNCDAMLVVGSSLIVNPAAQLPVLAKRSGAVLAIINRTPTKLDQIADVRINGESGPTLTALAEALTAPRDHRSS